MVVGYHHFRKPPYKLHHFSVPTILFSRSHRAHYGGTFREDFTKENFEDFDRLLLPLMGSLPPHIKRQAYTLED